MRAFRDFSIINKLRVLVMIISIIALLMACGLLGAREIINFRKTLVHELSLLSKIVADRSTASLVFDDPHVAEETLSALKAKHSIVSAYIFNDSGIVFASYHREDIQPETPPNVIEPKGWKITANKLIVVTPILLDKKTIGTVVINSDLKEMYTLIWEYIAYIFLVFIVAILISFFMLSKLQRFISRPILDLAKAVSMTAINMNYSTRVTKKGNDEIGLLVDTFNTMLDQIENRDIKLSESKNRAEASAKKARDLAKETYRVNIKLEKEITERKRAYNAMIQSEKKYRGIFENAQEGIFRASPKNRFIDVNPSMASILGYDTPAELVEAISDIRKEIFADDPEKQQFYLLLEKNDEVSNFECRLKRKDGSLIWGSVQVLAFRDLQNNLQYVEGLIEDITDRKRAEKALKNAYKQLEKRVEERTAELRKINKELRNAKDAADIATNAKSEFLANMSHEIRTPMSGVISAAELALSEEMPLKVQYYLKIIRSSGNALLGIINDILDFSKIDAGMLKLDHHPFRLDVILNNVIAIFSSVSAEKNIELLLDITPDTPMDLIGDSLRIQQILTNLLGNAVKFTESEGLILIRIYAESKTPDTVMFSFSVKDTGIGMTSDQRNVLFDAFTQGDTSTTRKFGGTGLGLCICQQLVDLMHGQIYVESHIGKGSEFTFTAQIQLQPEQTTKNLILSENLKKLNVLIVDDIAESRKIMSQLINTFGFYSESVNSGMSAINLLKEYQHKDKAFDLAIIDMKMPHMDGYKTAMEIRNRLRLNFPVILMSDAIANIDLSDDETMPIAALIAKPITTSSLFNSIMDVFDGKPLISDKPLPDTITGIKKKSPSPLDGLKVLVVEDNRVNQEIAVEVLKSVGIVPRIAADGIEAVKAVSNEPFDAILMDIQMPNMDGYEATRKIREIKKFQSLPIIAMTASVLLSDEKKCLEAGMNGFVPKPIRQDKLFETLLKLVRPGMETDLAIETSAKTSRSSFDTQNTPDTPKPSAIDPPLEKLPGLHIRQATQDLKIDYEIYKKILSRFFNRNVQTINRMRSAANQKDWKQLKFLIHNIKGSSANIGAVHVKETAHQIEQFCKDIKPKKTDISGLNRRLDEFEKQLNQLFSSIKKIINIKEMLDNAETSAEIDPSKITPIMSNLLKALYDADPEKINICLSHIKKFNKGALMSHVITKINEYEYESAVEALIKTADKMGITLHREQKANEER